MWFSIGESKRLIKTCGVTNRKKDYLAEEFEDRAIFSLMEFFNLSIYFFYISAI
jgi:hypothetical protein